MRAIEDGLTTMREVEVDTKELLAIVEENREKHLVAYQQAVIDRKDVALAKAEAALGAAATNLAKARTSIMEKIESLDDDPDALPAYVRILNTIDFEMPVPQNRVADYDAVISMLRLERRQRIKIDSSQHACFVLDDWDWKKDFDKINSGYMATKMSLGLE